ncbi:MAG: hypothetical protein QM538_02070 [Methylacidiphilales bacterium]|nr:hypothetical protein [Candidatus Methylacidiphilales bacterium]
MQYIFIYTHILFFVTLFWTIFPNYGTATDKTPVAILLNHNSLSYEITESFFKGLKSANTSNNTFTFEPHDTSQLITLQEWSDFFDSLQRKNIKYFIGPVLKNEVIKATQVLNDKHSVGIALNYIERIETDIKTTLPNISYLSISPKDDIDMLVNLLTPYLGKHIVILPETISNNDFNLPEYDIFEFWYYDESSANFNELVSYLLHSDLSQARMLQLVETIENKVTFQQRRRQDIKSITILGSNKNIATIKSFLNYYYIDQVPIFIPITILDKWNIKSIINYKGSLIMGSTWLNDYSTNLKKLNFKELEIKKLNPFFFALGFDSITLLSNIIKSNHDLSKLPTLLGTYIFDPRSGRFKRNGTVSLIDTQSIISLNQNQISFQLQKKLNYYYKQRKLLIKPKNE